MIASQSEQIGILRNGSQGPELVKFESLWMIGTNPGEKCRVVVLKIFLYKHVPQSDSLGFAWKGCYGPHLNVFLYHKFLAFQIIEWIKTEENVLDKIGLNWNVQVTGQLSKFKLLNEIYVKSQHVQLFMKQLWI